jgi:hypothetical protein
MSGAPEITATGSIEIIAGLGVVRVAAWRERLMAV